MKLIVGLGNPGKKYEKTRHNMGFMVVDLFSDVTGIDVDKEAFNGLLGRGKFLDEDVIILKPQTFMNLSGNAVQQVVHFFKINLEDIIVVYDDMALPPGSMRMREMGSSGGQKGIQNIIDMLGTKNINIKEARYLKVPCGGEVLKAFIDLKKLKKTSLHDEQYQMRYKKLLEKFSNATIETLLQNLSEIS